MHINFSFFNKQNFPNFLYYHFLYSFIIILFAIILTYKTISPFYSIILILGLMYYSYFIHVLLHILPQNISPHLLFHHNPEQNSTKNGKIVSFIIEAFFVDIGIFYFLYIIQKMINYELFPVIFIVYYGLIYISIHNINYSICHAGNHPDHHLGDKGKISTNFGPDSIDHFLGTNQNSTFEHMYHFIPNIIFAFLTTAVIYHNNDLFS